jgi:two-component system, cell cycle sensor histidine kinase and response regulator CckA
MLPLLAAFVVGGSAVLFFMAWRLSLALWRAAQADTARAQSESRMRGLLSRENGLVVTGASGAHAHAERVQAATYAISEAASSAASLGELFAAIHAAVGELMPARNFYIAIYDPTTDLLSFPYFVDEVDPAPGPKPLGKGITEHVLRTGEPLLASPSVAAELEHTGRIELIGAPSIDWLGVPLKVADRTFGVLVVQSYTEGIRYSDEDKAILIFVSRQVAMAIARTQAQEALRAGEQKLRDIIEHSTNLFYSHTPEHVLTYVSPQARQFFDAEPEELLVRWTELTTDNPLNRIGFERTEEAIRTGQPQPVYELELVGMRGRKIWVEVREAPVVRDSRTVAIVGSLTDITERRRVEEALRASEATNRAILEAIPDIVFRVGGNGVFLDYKASRLGDLVMPPERFLGKHVAEVLPPDVARLSAENLAAALSDSRVHVYEYDLELSGERRSWECRMVASGDAEVVAIIREITERRRAEQALRESEERYRRLVELSPDGIAIHRDGCVVFCNRTGARMLGFGVAEEVIGRPILDFVQAEFRDVVGRRVRDALARGQSQPPIQEKFVRADGSPIDVEVTSTPYSFGGRPAVLVVFRDITPRLRLEEHVRHMQKMEAIGRLAGGVAHDFNNLLQALLSTVDVLQVRGHDPEKVASTILELETNIKRGAALTRQLLLFARRELVRPERVDLNDVVTKAATLLRRLVRANIRLTLVSGRGDLPLDADRGQLEQVLLNLVVNAADAMPEAGELTIRTGCLGDDEVWVEVTDTGVGIAPDVQKKIFEPFFTTKSPERGTGMGLAVVHGIITQHRGRIEVTSTVGKGSTFRAVLPRAGVGRTAAPRPQADPAGVVALAHGEHVLVVEDEEGARRALQEILHLLGFSVTTAGSGEEGEELAVRERFDVLLTDFVLPGIDGGELARRLAAATPALRVIVMSGYAEDESMRLGVMTGTVRFLQKPFDVETLSRAMRDALADGGEPS